MNQFGIYSPVLGEQKTIPHIFLNKAFLPDAKNVQMWDGRLRSSYGRSPEMNASGVAVQIDLTGVTAADKPIIKLFSHIWDDGSESLFAFTPKDVQRWDATGGEWDIVHEVSGDTVKSWSVVSFQGQVIATNGVEVPIISDAIDDTAFADLTATISSGVTITTAKAVTSFENHLIFGGFTTSENSANEYQNGIIWSDLDDATSWTPVAGSDAGSAYVEGDGIISGFGKKHDLLYVFKTKSTRVFWYTGTSLIFASKPYGISVGTYSPNSIINDATGNLLFYASDMTFREVDAGIISDPIKSVAKDINQEELQLARIDSAFIEEYRETWWTVPSGVSETNNLVLCFQNGIWYERDIPVSAFGKYLRLDSPYTWDNIPESTWDDWNNIWNESLASTNSSFDLCSDYYGYVYTSHLILGDTSWDGTSAMVSNSREYYFVLTTDLADKAGLRYFKRLLYLYGYFTSVSSGSPVTISIKQDSEADWQVAGTMDTSGTMEYFIGELPVDYRGRTFLVKVSSNSPFEFLGMEFEYLPSGLR